MRANIPGESGASTISVPSFPLSPRGWWMMQITVPWSWRNRRTVTEHFSQQVAGCRSRKKREEARGEGEKRARDSGADRVKGRGREKETRWRMHPRKKVELDLDRRCSFFSFLFFFFFFLPPSIVGSPDRRIARRPIKMKVGRRRIGPTLRSLFHLTFTPCASARHLLRVYYAQDESKKIENKNLSDWRFRGNFSSNK